MDLARDLQRSVRRGEGQGAERGAGANGTAPGGGEDPGAIVADIRSAIIDHPDVWIEHDRGRAIREAISRAGAGDVVLVAGKGHEAWQLLAGERREFSDRAVVRAALGEDS